MSINSFALHESSQMLGNIFDENGVNYLRQTTRNMRIISIRKVKLKSYHTNEISVVYSLSLNIRVALMFAFVSLMHTQRRLRTEKCLFQSDKIRGRSSWLISFRTKRRCSKSVFKFPFKTVRIQNDLFTKMSSTCIDISNKKSDDVTTGIMR